MASALSAISSLIASTTGNSSQANQASGLQKQLSALQKQLASADCETCDDTRQTNQALINRQIQKVQTQLSQVQPTQAQQTDSGSNANSGQSSQSQNSASGSTPSISFSHQGGFLNTTA